EQCLGDVVADDLVVCTADAFQQGPLPGQVGRVGAGEPIGAGHVDGEQVRALGPVGDPGGPADQGVALRTAGERDDDPFAGLPGTVDAVLGPVPVQLVVDLVGQPQQGQFAQRGEVADPEVVAEGGVDLLRLVHVA